MGKLFANKHTRILGLFFLALAVWWVAIFLRGQGDTTEAAYFDLAYGLIPLIWGVIGLRISHFWGGFKSSMGRSVRFLSLGMLAWGIGNLIYNYYTIVVGEESPYPSPADYIFILSFPLWAIGITYLSRASGMFFSLRRLKGKMLLLLIPLIVIAVSYYLLFVVAYGGEIDTTGGLEKLILDLSFPVGDVLILTFGLILYGLSFNYLGGRFKLPIIITLAGFVLAYFTDFAYSYTTTLETYYLGHWVDMMYTTMMFLLSLGITSLDPRLVKEEA